MCVGSGCACECVCLCSRRSNKRENKINDNNRLGEWCEWWLRSKWAKKRGKIRRRRSTGRKMAMNRFIKYTIFLSIAIVYYLIHSFDAMAETPKATLKWRKQPQNGIEWTRKGDSMRRWKNKPKRRSFIIDIAIIKLCSCSTRLHFSFSLKHSVFFFPSSGAFSHSLPFSASSPFSYRLISAMS